MAPRTQPLAYESDAAPPTSLPIDTTAYRTTPFIYVNGKIIDTGAITPTTTLLAFLRANHLTGTKLGCAEGGCGACTVMISKHDPATATTVHRAVNACLFPAAAADYSHVTTVEGIGSVDTELNPIQSRMVAAHGSQCGFCTPGIVMSMYTLFRSNPSLSTSEVEEHMDGNLCRCTGYRPIWDAAKSLCDDARTGPCGNSCATCPSKHDCEIENVHTSSEHKVSSHRARIISCTNHIVHESYRARIISCMNHILLFSMR